MIAGASFGPTFDGTIARFNRVGGDRRLRRARSYPSEGVACLFRQLGGKVPHQAADSLEYLRGTLLVVEASPVHGVVSPAILDSAKVRRGLRSPLLLFSAVGASRDRAKLDTSKNRWRLTA